MRHSLVAALLLTAGVPTHLMAQTRDAIYEVDSFRVPCEEVAPRRCLRVRRGEHGGALAEGEWSLFYGSIQGFRYEAGYRYRLSVRETELPPEQVPADTPSTRFELLEVLDKRRDLRLRLHDVWMMIRVDGADAGPLRSSRAPHPRLELYVARSEYLGSDGCNHIQGTLEELDETRLRFGAPTLAGRETVGGDSGVQPTSAPCDQAELRDRFRSALKRVVRWERDRLELVFFDADGNEVLAFRKTD